jgi:UDP-glucose 4-epimerase
MSVYFKGKNILITGGLGFLGSNLAHRLSKYNANITVVDNLNPIYGGNKFNVESIYNNIKVIIDDIRNKDILVPLVESADIIYHLAAQVSYIDSLSIPYEDLDLNARATLDILECCRKYNCKARILFSSSRMIYGKVDQELVPENYVANPLSLYGIHKLASEKYIMMYYNNFGIPGTILRLTNPYGPRQQIKHNKYSLVGWFIRQAMEGKTIQIFGEGTQLRDYIYVDDIVNVMLKCAEADAAIGEVFNVGSGEPVRFCDMVRTVIDCVKTGNLEFIPWPENYEKVETGDISLDTSKLRHITSWEPAISLQEGVKKTFNYYKVNFNKYV